MSAVTDEAREAEDKGMQMTATGTAARLIAKYGQQDAIQRIETRIDGLRLYWGTGLTSRAEAAKLNAYLMLWSAVRYHLTLGPA